MSAQDEIGPVMAPRHAVYQAANEIGRIAQTIRELATPGVGEDMPRARKLMERIAGIAAGLQREGSADADRP